MAIKGQKFKKYSSKLKEQILIEYFDEGKSPSYLSSKYGIQSTQLLVEIGKLEKVSTSKLIIVLEDQEELKRKTWH